MSARKTWSDSSRWPGSGNAVLRRRNGSIDIGAYAAIAHRERATAIAASMLSAVSFIRDAGTAIATRVRRQRRQTLRLR